MKTSDKVFIILLVILILCPFFYFKNKNDRAVVDGIENMTNEIHSLGMSLNTFNQLNLNTKEKSNCTLDSVCLADIGVK